MMSFTSSARWSPLLGTPGGGGFVTPHGPQSVQRASLPAAIPMRDFRNVLSPISPNTPAAPMQNQKRVRVDGEKGDAALVRAASNCQGLMALLPQRAPVADSQKVLALDAGAAALRQLGVCQMNGALQFPPVLASSNTVAALQNRLAQAEAELAARGQLISALQCTVAEGHAAHAQVVWGAQAQSSMLQAELLALEERRHAESAALKVAAAAALQEAAELTREQTSRWQREMVACQEVALGLAQGLELALQPERRTRAVASAEKLAVLDAQAAVEAAQHETAAAQELAEAARRETAAAKADAVKTVAAQKKLAEKWRSRSRRAQEKSKRLREMLPVSAEWSAQFEKLLTGRGVPDAQSGLRDLWECQLRCLKSKGHRCYWHPKILAWCADVWRQDRKAYEQMAFGGVMILPHPDTVRKYTSSFISRPGHNLAAYSALGCEVKNWSESAREVILKFDEINILNGLAWRKVGGSYEFVGLASKSVLSALFPDESKVAEVTAAQQVSEALASNALVFQVTSTGRDGKRLQRVVGIHPTRDCTADHLHDIFWETVGEACPRIALPPKPCSESLALVRGS